MLVFWNQAQMVYCVSDEKVLGGELKEPVGIKGLVQFCLFARPFFKTKGCFKKLVPLK